MKRSIFCAPSPRPAPTTPTHGSSAAWPPRPPQACPPTPPGAPPDRAAREALRDEAIAAYRHILDARPGLAGARLELARVLFERGRCLAEPDNLLAHIMGDDCDAAAYHYRLALAGDLPGDIVEAVSRFLAVIRARKRFSGSFSFAVAPDTNINSATAARTLPADIHIYGLPGDKWLLPEEQRETSGIGAVVSAFGEYTHPLTLRVFDDSFTRLRAGGGVYRREYARRRFDDMTVFLHAGPQLLFPRGLVALLAKGDQRWYRGEPLSRAFGARAEGALGLNERLWVRAGVEWLERRYRKSDSSDGPRLDLDAELTYSLTPAISIGARAGWARGRAESKYKQNPLRPRGGVRFHRSSADLRFGRLRGRRASGLCVHPLRRVAIQSYTQRRRLRRGAQLFLQGAARPLLHLARRRVERPP